MELSSDRVIHGPPLPPSIHTAPNCPRCDSSNTKFCYYNNYSLSQPRFFCKGCKRYWTKGGSLRNVPAGGGCRKSRRRSRSAKAAASNLITSTNSPSSDTSREYSVPGIDMAAVFARFLSHDDHSIVSSPSSDASRESLTSASPISTDDILGLEPLLSPDKAMQGFISPDFASFDDLMDDVFGSDESNISDSFTWQEEIHSNLLPDDQPFNVAADLVSTDNWSHFDSTDFEIFY